jgi:hypothetical protein
MEFKISGIVREKESQTPVPGLLIRAFDKDLFFTDLLGNAITDVNGLFAIGYEGKDFQELFEKRPDIFLNIYGSATAEDPGRPSDKPIFTTKGSVRFNAGRHEFFVIEIPRDELGDDSPGTDIITTPEPGEWKELIDKFIEDNPIDFEYNPDKGFMSPKLECTSNFGPEIREIDVGESTTVTVRVTNKGNGISFNTYVEVYEGPGGYNHALQEYRLCDYKIAAINPGQTVDIKLGWSRLLSVGRIVGLCFDPFLDPRGFYNVEQYNDHITSIHYGYGS